MTVIGSFRFGTHPQEFRVPADQTFHLAAATRGDRFENADLQTLFMQNIGDTAGNQCLTHAGIRARDKQALVLLHSDSTMPFVPVRP